VRDESHGTSQSISRTWSRFTAIGIEEDTKHSDQLRIEKWDFGWAVYYFERGNTFDLREFLREEDACDYFLSLVERDSSIRLRR
jgi:hypothetical protein